LTLRPGQGRSEAYRFKPRGDYSGKESPIPKEGLIKPKSYTDRMLNSGSSNFEGDQAMATQGTMVPQRAYEGEDQSGKQRRH